MWVWVWVGVRWLGGRVTRAKPNIYLCETCPCIRTASHTRARVSRLDGHDGVLHGERNKKERRVSANFIVKRPQRNTIRIVADACLSKVLRHYGKSGGRSRA